MLTDFSVVTVEISSYFRLETIPPHTPPPHPRPRQDVIASADLSLPRRNDLIQFETIRAQSVTAQIANWSLSRERFGYQEFRVEKEEKEKRFN